MGGPSAEHEISLKTGAMVLKNLERGKYSTFPFLIAKNGKWPMTPKALKKKCDMVFIAMHGEFGEDGTVQAILEKSKIPYTGSGVKASRLGMDKVKSFKIFARAGLNVPDYEVLKNNKGKIKINLPLVVKPADRGSSVGLSIVQNPKKILAALKLAFKFSRVAIVQKYIRGRELTCGVLEINGRPRALPVTEIIPLRRVFFDYYSKYTKGASDEITPANLPKNIARKIQKAALLTHKAIGASGYSRSDFILGNDGDLYILEINTLPGMTATSLVPQAAQAVGIPFPKLLDLIIESALKKR